MKDLNLVRKPELFSLEMKKKKFLEGQNMSFFQKCFCGKS